MAMRRETYDWLGATGGVCCLHGVVPTPSLPKYLDDS